MGFMRQARVRRRILPTLIAAAVMLTAFLTLNALGRLNEPTLIAAWLLALAAGWLFAWWRGRR
jgi:hypothetical protein